MTIFLISLCSSAAAETPKNEGHGRFFGAYAAADEQSEIEKIVIFRQSPFSSLLQIRPIDVSIPPMEVELLWGRHRRGRKRSKPLQNRAGNLDALALTLATPEKPTKSTARPGGSFATHFGASSTIPNLTPLFQNDGS